jgi:prophage regulatory protein
MEQHQLKQRYPTFFEENAKRSEKYFLPCHIGSAIQAYRTVSRKNHIEVMQMNDLSNIRQHSRQQGLHLPNVDPLQCPQTPSHRIIRIGVVMEITSISRSQIYNLASTGRFPKSIPLVPGGSSVGWLESEINDWVAERIQARNEGVNHA